MAIVDNDSRIGLSIVCDLEEFSQIWSPIHSNVICKWQNPYLKLGNIGDAVNSVILINASVVLSFVCKLSP